MDFTEEKKTTGKNIGDDFKAGKTTLPVILAWNESNKKKRLLDKNNENARSKKY